MEDNKYIIKDLKVHDIRFPTSDLLDGSDAVHTDPDYSATYVVINLKESKLEGHGLTFTIGKGNEICVAAVKALKHLVVDKSMNEITGDFGTFWKSLTNHSQLRWVGPEKGVIHLAVAAIINAIWDLYAKIEKKPLWKLLCDMTPEQLIKCIDFRYISDVLSKEEALDILKSKEKTKKEREAYIKENGYPAYTTSTGWLGYSDEKLRKLCKSALANGWDTFKVKVGSNLEDDIRRLTIIREEIGYDKKLMIDANQKWDVNEAIEWIKQLSCFNLWWVEEPTSPDDILGHAKIAKEIAPIGVATGEQCQNRVIFKQLLQTNAISFCQIDSCRLGGVNEILSVLLMAAKFNIPVCPHAGGTGLCEYVQHLAIFDYVCVSGSLENRIIEYVEHLHEHFEYPVTMKNNRYMPPTDTNSGYSITMKNKSIEDYTYPDGSIWKEKLKIQVFI